MDIIVVYNKNDNEAFSKVHPQLSLLLKILAFDYNLLYFSSMKGFTRRSLIKPLHSNLPHGMPFNLAMFNRFGVSSKQASQYAKSGWFTRLGQGYYSFPNDKLDIHTCVKVFQNHVEGLHIAGRSALALQGVYHNLSFREQLLLWGDKRFLFPQWFTSLFTIRYTYSKLFEWKDDLSRKSLTTPPGLTEGLLVSVPERAVLEMLSEVGTHQGLEEARNIFDGLRNLRFDMLGRLLSCCTSIKTKRLFLTWAEETNIVNIDHLKQSYNIQTGSTKRWMKRLPDGTLLSLNFHG